MELSNTLTQGKNAIARWKARFTENAGKRAKKTGEKAEDKVESKIEKQAQAASTQRDDMRQYSRSQLLEVILLQSRENDNLKASVKRLETELSDRTLKLNKTGNIAEAALALSGVFKAAEEAVSQYKENIRRMSEDSEAVAGGILKDAEERAQSIIDEAERKAGERLDEAEKAANALAAKAQVSAARSKLDADKYWNDLSAKLEALYNQKQGIRDMAESLNEEILANEAEQ